MADQNIIIKFQVEGAEAAANSTKQLSGAIEDVNDSIVATNSALNTYQKQTTQAAASADVLEKRLRFMNNGLKEEAYEIKNGEIVLKQKTTAQAAATIATNANTVATNTATLATKAFTVAANIAKAAISALKIAITGGLVVAVTLIAQNWDKFGDKLEARFPLLGKIADKARQIAQRFTDWAGITSQLQRELEKLNDELDYQNESLSLDAKYYKEVEKNAKKLYETERQIILNRQQKLINAAKTRELNKEEILQLKDIAIELQILDKNYEENTQAKKNNNKETEKQIKLQEQTEYLISLTTDTLKLSSEVIEAIKNALPEKGLQILSQEQIDYAKALNVQLAGLEEIGARLKAQAELQADTTSSANDNRKKAIDDEKEYIGYLVESLQFVNDLTGIIASARSAKIQSEIDDLERLKDAELQNAELTARQKERIEERYQQKIAQLKTKQAQAQRRADIIQAIVNTALAVTQALGNPIRAALAAALGAAQIAVIARQPLPKFRKGGEIAGKRHESGGVHIEAEGGEWIHKREAVAYYGKDFMKDINEMRIPKSVLMPDLPAAVISGAMTHGIDHDRLAKTIGKELAKQPKISIALDERGFTKHLSEGSNRTNYANRKFNAA